VNLDTAVRYSLWLSAPLNVIVGFGFADPSGWVGSLIGLPTQTHPFFAWFGGAMVAIFGFVYAWLALQPTILKPMLFVGASGKLAAVAICVALYAQGQLSGVTTLIISGDLFFVVLWAGYLILNKSR